MAGCNFETDLVEMESALRAVNGLISDNFGGPAAAGGASRVSSRPPLSRLPFQYGAASDVQQSDAAAAPGHGEVADDGNVTLYGQDFLEAETLDDAHANLLESLLQLRSSVERGIQTLQQNLQATHQTYSSTEENINLRVTTIAPMTVVSAAAASTSVA